ncbi:MAG: exodeoxyribonuclease III [Synergistaceae bacterium]|nr:exodeoxyribonuclease III [Synergistaceae bacterium]
MLIATFNVNSVRSRLHILERWLDEVKPDLLFMQETKTQDKTFPEEFFMSHGYKSYYHGEKMHNGVAVIARDLDVHVDFGFSDGEYDTRVLTLTYKDIVILNTYVPQGRDIEHRDYDRKKEFFALVRKVIERNHEGKFIWLGDMNVAPEVIDVTHPENKKNHVCFTKEIRRIYADTKRGLIDLHRKFHPYERIYTFYDYRVKEAVTRQIGWRIDHMLATDRLAECARSCISDIRVREWERPSDHVPLVCEIEV